MNKITAEEARKITENLTLDLSECYTFIKTAAEKGRNKVRWDIPTGLSDYSEKIINQLKENGYGVYHENGYEDRPGGTNWDYLEICW